MLKKLTSSIIAAVTGVFLATSISSAATFDFVAIADTGVAPFYGEKGGNPLSFASGGYTLDATGTKAGVAAYAYLDKSGIPETHVAPAGLGVCGFISISLQCFPGSDDNVTAEEVLTLTFNKSVTLTGWDFNGAAHGAGFVPPDSLDVSIDGGAFVNYLLTVPGFANFDGITGTTIALRWFNEDFYLASISVVPLPPAILLFGAALMGLGWLGRRRKTNITA